MCSARRLFGGVFISITVRWLLALSCVTCAAFDRDEATDTFPYLVYTSGAVIYRVNMDGSGAATVLDNSGQDRLNKLGIDFDFHHGRLFWVDSTLLNIMSSNLDGSGVQTVASTGFLTLERLAYDWITDKIYWSDFGAAEIGIVDLQSGTRIVLIVTGQQRLSRPRALALDPSTRNMYWADWLEETGAALIERASMDGQNRRVIVNSSISRPYDLAIDIDTQTLYFIDGYFDRLESVNVDGTGRQILQSFRVNIVPYSLVFCGSSLYWTERLDRLISTLRLEDNHLSNVTVTDVRPAGLTLIAAERQPLESVWNPCNRTTNRCSHICLLSSSDTRGFSCACEEGIELDQDNLTCKVSTPAPTSTVLTSSTGASSTAVLLLPSSPEPSASPKMCPCMNGGVCSSLSGSQVRCLCPSNFTGEFCEKHINNTGVCELAMGRTCKNGATCVNIGVYEYRCKCPPEYEGRYCGKRSNYGICNVTKPCQNRGVCTNLKEDGGYWCKCQSGFTGVNCTVGHVKGDSAITPSIFVGVIAGFALVVGVLVLVLICVFAMFKKQKDKNKSFDSANVSRSNSPIIKKRSQQRSEETPSSTDTVSHDYWSIAASLSRLPPHITHGQSNIYTQIPQRGVPPDLGKYAKAKSYSELSRESRVLTV